MSSAPRMVPPTFAPPSRAQKRRERARHLEGKDVKSIVVVATRPSSVASFSLPQASNREERKEEPPRGPRVRDYGNYPEFQAPTNREGRRLLAARMLEIVAAGGYQPMHEPTQKKPPPRVNLAASIAAALAGTRLIRVRPDELKMHTFSSSATSSASASSSSASSTSPSPPSTVTGCGSAAMAIRVSVNTSVAECLDMWNRQFARSRSAAGFHLALLNFASGARPGGGGLSGAQAQEESLIRVSSLHSCLDSPHVEAFYAEGRKAAPYYADALIWSPHVPFFSDDGGWLLARDEVAHVSVLTVAAVNCRSMSLEKALAQKVEDCMERRMVAMLNVARDHGVTHLVLGAWGCGVFRSTLDTEYEKCRRVAAMFRRVLLTRFPDAFQEVVFALAQSDGDTPRGFADGLFPRHSAPSMPPKPAPKPFLITPPPSSSSTSPSSSRASSPPSSTSTSTLPSSSRTSSSTARTGALTGPLSRSSLVSTDTRTGSTLLGLMVPHAIDVSTPPPPSSTVAMPSVATTSTPLSVPTPSTRPWDPTALLVGIDVRSLGRGGTIHTDSSGGGVSGGGASRDRDRRHVSLAPCVLVLSGSMCPVHGGHLGMFTAAAAHLRALGHVVIGGVLAPSSDKWVASKFASRGRGDLALSLAERVHLCRLAAKQMDTVTMHVCDWGWASATRIMHEIRRRLPWRLGVTVVELAGSDVIANPKKSRSKSDRILIGFVRADADPEFVARFVAECEREVKSTGAASRHLLRGTPTSAVSSSHILDTLFSVSPSASSSSTSGVRSDPMASLVVSGMLHPKVAEWLATKWASYFAST